ncbi:MAG TPA: prepilin-type N-terminal cleavage/methylation domain-containing protein [Candidatus Saccharimonadales bacterium]|nr:prepilin-type N-terminal cleavage/methylation domain-containing protein [Candidatus Saccharimonadales bacterium]
MLKKYSQKGFTIVELLIVIVVIGILAALVLNTFSGVQRRARDTERQTDINSVATQLEVYYNDNGGYPVFTGQIADATWVKTNLKGIDAQAIIAPGAASGTTNSFANAQPAAGAYSAYGYQAFASDGTTACTTAPCSKFKLTWRKEDGDSLQTKDSLN